MGRNQCWSLTVETRIYGIFWIHIVCGFDPIFASFQCNGQKPALFFPLAVLLLLSWFFHISLSSSLKCVMKTMQRYASMHSTKFWVHAGVPLHSLSNLGFFLPNHQYVWPVPSFRVTLVWTLFYRKWKPFIRQKAQRWWEGTKWGK